MSAQNKRISSKRSPYKSFTNRLRAAHAEAREIAFDETIRSIPKGKVASYGQVASAAGYPRAHRLVARFLGEMSGSDIPWQRVIGSGGEIKLRGKAAATQRSLLKAEGVVCARHRIDMKRFGHIFDS